ncbi:acetyl-CoA acetyltransferase [Nocardioides insulae]|uniref:acetyl-CoA acetyltransferase n=1 Tax=Nocardioides insulae TaxID=394734 RepID=UPI00040FEA3B|nr:acetyl-CoA acetyltransferase [Nocardioides insulae]
MTATSQTLPETTPVLIGVGQYAERLDDQDYRALSPIDLAVRAARAALEDAAAADGEALGQAVGVIATTRQFENSVPGAPAPLGRSANFPRSVAARLGIDPGRAVLEVAGGQSPQHLVTEFAGEIAAGRHEVVLLAGSEAISTIRHLAGRGDRPDFSDDPGGDQEDRGFGLEDLRIPGGAEHGLVDMPTQYALCEHARRARAGVTPQEWALGMGRLFAPFTRVAAGNPFSAAPVQRTAEELVAVTESNRMIADPYPRYLVARDQVNQGAAVLIASVGAARRLGVPEDRWVYLSGHADLRERSLLDRADLAESPAAVMAVQHALAVAGLGVEQLSYLDLYSCFPIAVSNVADALGLAADDPRGLTLTGGLPFFGGAGNNYSMHGIAEAVARVRADRGSFALVGANGGVLSKYSVGIYSTVPAPHRPDDSSTLQREIDAWAAPQQVAVADGPARIEAFTIAHRRTGGLGIVVGRLERGDGRFLATVPAEDLQALLDSGEEPVGRRVVVRSTEAGNRVSVG